MTEDGGKLPPGGGNGSDDAFHIRLASSPEEIQQCQSLRHAIFVVEQNTPSDIELDGKDDQAFHVVVCHAGDARNNETKRNDDSNGEQKPVIVGTGRVLVLPMEEQQQQQQQQHQQESPTATPITYKAVLGRIAVHSNHRGKGLGWRVVQELEKVAKSKGAVHASLTPHHYLERFYCSLGYELSPLKDGDKKNRLIYINEHCQLISMEKRLL